MRVLFVSSGNAGNGISLIGKNQGESLCNQGVCVEYFTILGRGIKGYLKNIKPLRKKLKETDYHLIHAHYSLSAYVASFVGAKPIIVSLMGSDVKSNAITKYVITIFSFIYKWDQIIVKSEDLKDSLRLKRLVVIPNGVNLTHFKPENKKKCQNQLNWDNSKKHILFAADTNRSVKNFKLALEAVSQIINIHFELHVLNNVPHNIIPIWINASDVIILTSYWEGSPNVIKEAMACNRPIVSTNVGDVKWVIGNTDGCYIASFDLGEYADKIRLALNFSEIYHQTNGRNRIIKLGLDSVTIAKKIINVYKHVLNKC